MDHPTGAAGGGPGHPAQHPLQGEMLDVGSPESPVSPQGVQAA